MSTDEELKQQAADMIEDLGVLIEERDNELSRTYQIAAVLHVVAKSFLDDVTPGNAEEQELYDLVSAAVYALENNTTVDEALLIQDEEKTE